jgi:hypothetical protein
MELLEQYWKASTNGVSQGISMEEEAEPSWKRRNIVNGCKLVISVDDGKCEVFAKDHLEELHHLASTNTPAIDTKKGFFFMFY